MVKFVDSELEELGLEVDQMWSLVYSQLEQSRAAVLGMDRSIAQQIIVRERRVDAFELKIDSDAEDFIALYNPVAVDLRFALAMLKINSDLERIGDYADGIARFVRDCEADAIDPQLLSALELDSMFGTVLEMLEELQDALRKEDPVKATAVVPKDELLDRIPLCLGLGAVIRKLERTGDHLTNIAEEIVFYIDAKVLKHKDPQGKEVAA